MVYLAALTILSALALGQYNDPPPKPLSHACGNVINNSPSSSWLYASELKDCLLSVPFHPEVATRFVEYFNQTLQFQSDTAYIKNPPDGYQQPPFDVFAAIDSVQQRIDTGYYNNQYAFEVDIQSVSLHMHDLHVYVQTGILACFSFSIPYNLVALSADGIALPEVYVYGGTTSIVQGAAIDTIDGKPAVDWLQEYAAQQSFGMLEPHADWNQLMASPAQLIQGSSNSLSGGGTFYPGDKLDVTYKNGTSDTWKWYAFYNSPGWTGPIATGGDFYNFFVLGNYPDNWESTYEDWQKANAAHLYDVVPENITAYTPETNTDWNYLNPAYPVNTSVHEADLGISGTGFVTGYYFDDISTAVLSIPSFQGGDLSSFTDVTTAFFQATDGADKVIIDLQRCGGGRVPLAYYLFDQFFPTEVPYGGSRRRDHPLADSFGSTLTGMYQDATSTDTEDYEYLDGDEWVVTERVNAATGRDFTSWQEFYGPVDDNGDHFSLTEQYYRTSTTFDGYALAGCHQDGSCQQRWKAEDIVLLTDGICSSACTLFVEMMTQAGARTVVVGGIPKDGPMQAASGSRGAVSYTSDSLDQDASYADTPQYDFDTGMWIDYLGITLRDQIRENNTIPTEFLYLPADCRIYWTQARMQDYTVLWHDVYDATWTNSSLCVAGSVNATTPVAKLPAAHIKRSLATYIEQGISTEIPESVHTPMDDNSAYFTYCDQTTIQGNIVRVDPDQKYCGRAGNCRYIRFPCTPDGGNDRWVCIPTCQVYSAGGDSCGGYCHITDATPINGADNAYNPQAWYPPLVVYTGYCDPLTDRAANRQCNLYAGTLVPDNTS